MPGELSADRVVVEDAPEASALYNRGYFGTPRSGGGLELDLLEAVYLVEAERLEVRRGGRAVSARDLFRAAGTAVPSFEIPYLVYRDLRQRGYIVESRSGSVDFQVYPRGGAPKKTPSKYWVRALSERAVFDLAELLERAEEAAAVRKTLLLGLVDEESDLTYYNVREALPTGDRPIGTPNERVVVHFLGDRAVVIDEAQGRALHEAGFFGKMIGRRLQLSLLETAFLLKGGFAEVRNADTDRPIGLARLTKEAKEIQPDFDLRLRAYEDLTGRGVISKTGFKYGSHFRAYEGDPETHHAKYLVHVVPKGHRGAWPEISRAVRLAHGVKKQILFAAKFPRFITHENALRPTQESLDRFFGSIGELRPKVATLVVQLPPFLHHDDGRDRLLAFLDGAPRDYRYAVEFRHGSWMRPDIFEALRRREVALVWNEVQYLNTTPEIKIGRASCRERE